ncbi:MAG: adenosylhomocysteinase [Acidimicrobiia bacterium]|nr:adenosylhomocysteinase [Acidimicrobiia bacterium]MBT8249621.1 adenosylhomocysteinase [Acidimicrobiia bacterium]NNL27794.1 adenosylhomocysteinase [Acidimicrobiia bacterium]
MSDITDPALAAGGHLRLEWAYRRMPVLQNLRERLITDKPLEGHTVAACLHVTAETANLMEVLRDGGAEVSLCASNPLSTQDDIAAALVERGIPVFARRGEDTDTYYEHLNAVLDTNPSVTMDDGADLVTLLHTSRLDITPLGSTEETTTGVIRLKAMAAEGELRIPVVAVNDSATKHLFDNKHGTGQSAIDGVLRATNILIAGRTVVVIGYGDCGQGVAQRADGLGARVIVVEVDPIRALSAAMDGFEVRTGDQAAEVGDLFITVTGDIHVLREQHFAAMKDGAILANAGHFDVELDLAHLREASVAQRRIREELEEFELPDGRRIIVISEGRLVNLSAAEGHPADVMDMSFANQAMAAEWIIDHHAELEPRVYRLPEHVDRDVASIKLASMGFDLDQLTSEQSEYLSSWRHGT